jgi:formylglycine-generating enzyme required for sulfatase activity
MFLRMGTRTSGLIGLALLFSFFCIQNTSAMPTVSNIRAEQRSDGTGIVDVFYDLSGGVGNISVALAVSSDGGANWDPWPTGVTGDIGSGVSNGSGKQIIWDSISSWTSVCSEQTRFRVTATDTSNPNELTIMLPGDVPMVLVRIPSGSFLMGRYGGELDGNMWEEPQHSVTIGKDFWMGKYEVTQQQWLALMESWPGTAPDASNGFGDNYPAYFVSWDDVKDFITELNLHIRDTAQPPVTVRLPSEAEWEYACRANTTTRFYWGDDLSYADVEYNAWYSGNNMSPYGTKPVGGKGPNSYGLYDMSGNVAEWCEDDYHNDYNGAPADGRAWIDSPTRGLTRVLRGGDFFNDGTSCRSASRTTGYPVDAMATNGFRIAASPANEVTITLPGDVPLVLKRIPAGNFMMGRYTGEADSTAAEDPQHLVTFDEDFWMGKYEVTQQQWLALMNSWPWTAPEAAYGVGNNIPAYYLSWQNARDFINALNGHIAATGQTPISVHLPSEAEWEYACRAGTSTRFYFGDSTGCAADCTDCAAGVKPGNRSYYMWFCANAGDKANPVGGKAPNDFGLFDMSGNIAEWCEDDYHDDYTNAPNNGAAWVGTPRIDNRVIRGGGWMYIAQLERSANRFYNFVDTVNTTTGFRVAGAPLSNVGISPMVMFDTERPTVWLNGGRIVSVPVGGVFTDPGAEAWDGCAGDLTAYIVPNNDVDTAMAGTYICTYGVADFKGNFTEIMRHVVVVEEITILLPGDIPMTLVRVPAGMYDMGKYVGERAGSLNESPQHSVDIGGAFYMGKYEVTQQQWLALMSDWPGTYPTVGEGLGDWYPAYYVSWDDAQNFVYELNSYIAVTEQGPLTVRLPSEAEWEYACRAWSTTRFYFGDSLDVADACEIDEQRNWNMWYCGNASSSQPVGLMSPNMFGLFDMHGNVWEWCEDDYHATYTLAPDDGSAWVDVPRGSNRVARGGYWGSNASDCRSARRTNVYPTNRSNQYGFRIIGSNDECSNDTVPPVINLFGGASVTVDCGDLFMEPGFEAIDNCDGDITWAVSANDLTDTSIPGLYTVTYDVMDAAMNAAVQVTRQVQVVDTVAPDINVWGDTNMTHECSYEFIDPGVDAWDLCDGDVNSSVVIGGDTVNENVPGTYVMTYSATDSSDNTTGPITRTVTVMDMMPPEITLLGNDMMSINCGGTFTDPGATAFDECEGDISAGIIVGGDTVNRLIPGDYFITYNVKR